jgi:carboxyl-terminal processing protease
VGEEKSDSLGVALTSGVKRWRPAFWINKSSSFMQNALHYIDSPGDDSIIRLSRRFHRPIFGGKQSMRAIRVIGFIVIIFIALGAGFIAGIATDQQGLVPVTGLISRPINGASPTPQPGKLNTDLIQQAYRIIEEHYADRTTLVNTNLTYGALTGMVEALGDTGHSRFLTPDMVRSEARQISGEFEGIGALLNVNQEGNPVILAPMDGSPAQKAGLHPGDIILEVNGADVSHSPLSDVVQKVIGPAGTNVTLTIRDPQSNQVRKVTITRAKIIVQNVTWQMLPGTNLAHIRIASFSNNVTSDLEKAIQAAKAQGAKGILLDLRNNPGGLLNEAVGVTSQFIKDGNVLQTKDAQGRVSTVPVQKGGIATDIPMVVLINQGSASAAEITAGAIQDYGRAQLVGDKTFGTGTVLNQFRLPDGSAILLATELWLTPKGRVIWHQGIAPDVSVPLATDISPSIPETERNLTADNLKSLKDVQLLKAIDLLQKKIQP